MKILPGHKKKGNQCSREKVDCRAHSTQWQTVLWKADGGLKRGQGVTECMEQGRRGQKKSGSSVTGAPCVAYGGVWGVLSGWSRGHG